MRHSNSTLGCKLTIVDQFMSH